MNNSIKTQKPKDSLYFKEIWHVGVFVVILYVIMYLFVSRLSFYLEAWRGNHVLFLPCFYFVPFDPMQIAETPWMEKCHYTLLKVFYPIYFVDNKITGIVCGGIPMVVPHDYQFELSPAVVHPVPMSVQEGAGAPVQSVSSDLKTPDSEPDSGVKSEK